MLPILQRVSQSGFTPKALPVGFLLSVVFIESQQRNIVIPSERLQCSAPILAV